MQKDKNILIFQGKNGAVELREDAAKETMWASLQQVANLFDTDKSGISRHIKNIYDSNELKRKGTVAKIATVQRESNRSIRREIEYYNLDVILSVGYRVNSTIATKFRQWATKTLRQHIVDGFTINKKRLAKNYDAFITAVENVKKLLPSGGQIKPEDALDLIKMFASTWFSLDAYDKTKFPKSGNIKRHVKITAEELNNALANLKSVLMKKREATELFGQEKQRDSVSGIIGNVFQSFGGRECYPTVEEKAAHLLYFMVKNHPFTDGNKRSGAFAYIWFLRRANILDTSKLTPEALTALTLFVAESNPKDKDQMIGLVLMLLKQ